MLFVILKDLAIASLIQMDFNLFIYSKAISVKKWKRNFNGVMIPLPIQ